MHSGVRGGGGSRPALLGSLRARPLQAQRPGSPQKKDTRQGELRELLFDQERGKEGQMQTPYDPWEAVNQPVFTFNLKLDEYVLRPVATGYDTIMPDAGQRSIDRFFKNLGILPRFANIGALFEMWKLSLSAFRRGTGFQPVIAQKLLTDVFMNT